jgi:hypothetical protein
MVLTVDSIRVSANPRNPSEGLHPYTFSKLCLYDPPLLLVSYHTMPYTTRVVAPVLLTYSHLQM